MHLEPFPQRVLWYCVFLIEMGQISPARHTVYWNSTNPRFHGGNYTVRVHINDYMDIVCPHYSLPQASAQDPAQAERFQLYMVDQEGYNTCSLNSKAFKRWQCDRPFAPFAPVHFLEKIQLFTPFSLGFEFRPGTDYYYISIPIQDLRDRCQRLQVSVCCEPTVRPTTKSQRSHTEEGVQQDASKARVRNRGSNIQLRAATYLLCLLLSSIPWWIQALPGA